jgi:hypothetical protein
MVRREAFLNKIRELGYSYKSQQAKTQLFKKKGGTHRMFIRVTDLLEDDFVMGSLRQAGLSDQEIKQFLSCARI